MNESSSNLLIIQRNVIIIFSFFFILFLPIALTILKNSFWIKVKLLSFQLKMDLFLIYEGYSQNSVLYKIGKNGAFIFKHFGNKSSQQGLNDIRTTLSKRRRKFESTSSDSTNSFHSGRFWLPHRLRWSSIRNLETFQDANQYVSFQMTKFSFLL